MYICNLLFGLEILMPGIFLGLKFQACVFFWVCNMKVRVKIPPPGVLFVQDARHFTLKEAANCDGTLTASA